MRKFRLFLLGCSHFCVDSYATMLAPVLPLINERLGLNLALAGFLGMILSITNLTQPLMGLWGDRMSRRILVTSGALMAAVFIPMLGLAENFLTLAAVLFAGGLGIAAFHPQSFSLAGELSAPRRASGIAVFAFAGTLGIGFTPLWIPLLVENLGIHYLPLASIPGIIIVALVGRFVKDRNPHVSKPKWNAQFSSLRGSAVPFLLITVVVVLRTVTFLGFGFFLTQLGRDRGLSLFEGSIPLAVYNLSGVAGSLAAGFLADRWDPKKIVLLTILLACPSLLAYLHAAGPVSYVWLALGGIGIMGSNAVLIAMAQELAPKNTGLASSLPLGFSWGLASFSLPLIGYFADQFGIAQALNYLALLPLPTAILAAFLPTRKFVRETRPGLNR
jgi:FSR family fosmidomycin resistance protein-like MFS transporter